MSLTDFWKIHPRTESRILEHQSADTDQFLENSSGKRFRKFCVMSRFGKVIQDKCGCFSRNRSSSWVMTEKNKFGEKLAVFPKIGLGHNPGNWNFEKIFGLIFRDLPIRVEWAIFTYTETVVPFCIFLDFHSIVHFINIWSVQETVQTVVQAVDFIKSIPDCISSSVAHLKFRISLWKILKNSGSKFRNSRKSEFLGVFTVFNESAVFLDL